MAQDALSVMMDTFTEAIGKTFDSSSGPDGPDEASVRQILEELHTGTKNPTQRVPMIAGHIVKLGLAQQITVDDLVVVNKPSRRGPAWAQTTELYRSDHGTVDLNKKRSGSTTKTGPQNRKQFDTEFLHITRSDMSGPQLRAWLYLRTHFVIYRWFGVDMYGGVAARDQTASKR